MVKSQEKDRELLNMNEGIEIFILDEDSRRLLKVLIKIEKLREGYLMRNSKDHCGCRKLEQDWETTESEMSDKNGG